VVIRSLALAVIHSLRSPWSGCQRWSADRLQPDHHL